MSEFSQRLTVSENGRFLTTEKGDPFFLLADTAWELFHRLNREEALYYLQTRASQGFNAVFAVALAEFDGLRTPNAYGDLPLHNLDPMRPNEAYFKFMDFVVEQAERLGMFVGLLPTWGDKWHQKLPDKYAGPEVFTPQNAAYYGEWLGRRYRGRSIIWVLGGDRELLNDRHYAIIQAMAEGLARGDGGWALKTFHPKGGESSAQYFHDAPWLDFNMIQSGHCTREQPNHDMVTRDYNQLPPRPCLDGEPRYENHPIMEANWTWQNGLRFDANDVRRAAYHALFAGACGHVYGCHDIWQMWDGERPPVNNANLPWHKAVHLEGATQMQHAKKLLESRPYFRRIPDQTLIASDAFNGRERIQATRDEQGTYAFVYIPGGQRVTINNTHLSGDTTVAWWYNPRTGTSEFLEESSSAATRTYLPPTDDDWVLVLDDKACAYPQP